MLYAGIGGGGHTYYDDAEQRAHIGGFGDVEALFGLDCKAGLSVGKAVAAGSGE